MQELNTTDEGVPIPPAAVYNIPVAPPTQPISRSTHNGDDKDKQSPPRSSMPPADEMASTNTSALTVPLHRPAEPLSLMFSTTETPAVLAPQGFRPLTQKNRHKGKGGARYKLNRVYRNKGQDEDVKTEDYDDLANPEDDVSSSMKPGAVAVGDIAIPSSRSSTPQTSTGFSRDIVVTDPFEPQIVAFLAPDDEDQQIVEARIAQKAAELLRRQMEEGEVVVADEVKDGDSSTCCGLKKRTMLLLGILALLMMIGGVVGGVLSSTAADDPGVPLAAPTPTPTSLAPTTLALPTLGDAALLEELISLNATFEKDIWQFEDPESPQYQALTWLKNDTIVMSPDRSTRDLLQRYVLAVLFYATYGPNWGWSKPYLSSDDVCSWNKRSEDYGVYCRLDGESINALILSDDFIVGSGWELPWELGLLTNLTILQLDFYQLNGTLPTELGQLVSLKSLEINAILTGTIPTELGQLRSLESLDLESMWLTGTIPTELGQLLSMTSLFMDSNQFSGTIPSELGELLSLTALGMYFNELTGTFPTELGQLLSLESLEIDYNQMTGTIPTELGRLISLTSLLIDNNQLSGMIPTELGQLLSLGSLDISVNQLTGTIPTELGQLLSLESLVMTDNQLTGTIPTELGQPLSLDFWVDFNQLTGSLEQSFCVENGTWDYYWVVDCDKVECSCCDCE